MKLTLELDDWQIVMPILAALEADQAADQYSEILANVAEGEGIVELLKRHIVTSSHFTYALGVANPDYLANAMITATELLRGGSTISPDWSILPPESYTPELLELKAVFLTLIAEREKPDAPFKKSRPLH